MSARSTSLGYALGGFLGVWLSSSTAFALTLEAEASAPSPTGTAIEFDVQASGEGELLYEWDFGDGTSTDPAADADHISHTYKNAGHFPVKVRAQDDLGAKSVSFVQTVHWPLAKGQALQSSSVVYDPARDRIYQVDPDNDRVAVIDAGAHTLIDTVDVYRRPHSVALDPDGRLWVVHQDDYAIAVVDPESLQIVAQVRLPYASQPVAIVISADRSRAYVSLRATGHVLALDLETLETVGDVDVGAWPEALATNPKQDRLFVTRLISPQDQGQVRVIDLDAFENSGTIELAKDPGPDSDLDSRGVPNYLLSAATTPDGRFLWVTGKKDNVDRGLARDGLVPEPDNTVRSVLYPIALDDETERLDLRLDQDNRSLPSSVVSSPLGDFLFVGFSGNNLVDVLDAYSGKKCATLSGAGMAPMGMLLTPDAELYVHGFTSRSVAVFDVAAILAGRDFAENKITEVITTDPDADKLSADELSGKRMFYDAADPRMSKEGYLSCATCHLEGFEDGRVWDFTHKGEGFRNTTALQGRRGSAEGHLHWTGNFDEIQDFENDIRNAFGGTGFLSDADWLSGTHSQTLGDKKAGLSPELDALATYAKSLDHVGPSPFRNPDGSMTDTALTGRDLFLSHGCDGCHSGDDFTDSRSGKLHDVGTIKPTSGQRLGDTLTGFDTPTLLGLWQTAPYLHDGSAATLHDVLVTENPTGKHGDLSDLDPSDFKSLERYLLELDSDLPSHDLPAITSNAGGAAGAAGDASFAAGAASAAGGAVASTGGAAGLENAGDATGKSDPSEGCACRLSPAHGRRRALASMALFALLFAFGFRNRANSAARR